MSSGEEQQHQAAEESPEVEPSQGEEKEAERPRELSSSIFLMDKMDSPTVPDQITANQLFKLEWDLYHTDERVMALQMQYNDVSDQMQNLQQQIQQLSEGMQHGLGELNLQLATLQHNTKARLYNAGATKMGVDGLTPLLSERGKQIPIFPRNATAFCELAWCQKRALGGYLGMTDPGVDPSPPEKISFLAKLRLEIGLKPFPQN